MFSLYVSDPSRSLHLSVPGSTTHSPRQTCRLLSSARPGPFHRSRLRPAVRQQKDSQVGREVQQLEYGQLTQQVWDLIRSIPLTSVERPSRARRSFCVMSEMATWSLGHLRHEPLFKVEQGEGEADDCAARQSMAAFSCKHSVHPHPAMQ